MAGLADSYHLNWRAFAPTLGALVFAYIHLCLIVPIRILLMSEIFILQNQAKLFLGRQNNWLDGRDLNALYKTSHKDEAINQMVEASSKDYTQRIKILSCAPNEKGLPLIDPELLPEPLPKPGKDLLAALEADAPEVHAVAPDTPAGATEQPAG